MALDKRRILRLAVVVAAIAGATVVAKRWPKDQTIHYVLGDAAARVEEVDARWAAGKVIAPDQWINEATYHYPPGQAPRVVTQEPHFADGNYTVEIVILADNQKSIVRKQLTLVGGVTSIDLALAVPQ